MPANRINPAFSKAVRKSTTPSSHRTALQHNPQNFVETKNFVHRTADSPPRSPPEPRHRHETARAEAFPAFLAYGRHRDRDATLRSLLEPFHPAPGRRHRKRNHQTRWRKRNIHTPGRRTPKPVRRTVIAHTSRPYNEHRRSTYTPGPSRLHPHCQHCHDLLGSPLLHARPLRCRATRPLTVDYNGSRCRTPQATRWSTKHAHKPPMPWLPFRVRLQPEFRIRPCTSSF